MINDEQYSIVFSLWLRGLKIYASTNTQARTQAHYIWMTSLRCNSWSTG